MIALRVKFLLYYLATNTATHSVASRTGFIFALFPGKRQQAQGERGARDFRDREKARHPGHFSRVNAIQRFDCIHLLDADFPLDFPLFLPVFASHSLVPAIETTKVNTQSQ